MANGTAGNMSVFRIFEEYGIDKRRIVLVELCPCDTKDELLMREAYHIKAVACVNKKRPIRTPEEKTEFITEYKKQYHQENKQKLNDKCTEYYNKNKLQINELKILKTTCECGSIHTKCDRNRHAKSAKHNNYIANQPIDV